jgi:hypothetical protein
MGAHPCHAFFWRQGGRKCIGAFAQALEGPHEKIVILSAAKNPAEVSAGTALQGSSPNSNLGRFVPQSRHSERSEPINDKPGASVFMTMV